MMAPETSSADSTPRLNRVKRKPAPTFDFREKYPELDPADPFAPLSVLRTRSSGAAFQLGSHDNLASQSTSQQLPVLSIYPSTPTTADFYGARPKSSSNARPAREGHYRTRSQSVAAFHPPVSYSPYGFWHQQSFVLEPAILPSPHQPPSLVADDSSASGTDGELDFSPTRPRGRSSHFFTPPRKISSQTSSRPRTADCVPSQPNKEHSIPTPSKRQRKANSTLLFSRQRPKTADSTTSSEIDYYGSPESTFVRQQKRASFSPLVHTTILPPPELDSYVHVPSPSESSTTSYAPPSSSTSGYSTPLSIDTSVGSSSRAPASSSPSTASQNPEWKLPTPDQIARAGAQSIIAPNGIRVSFSSLFESQRTIVIFIRHFWCPMCQDYMAQLSRIVDPTLLAVSGLRLAIIGNGSPSLINKYKAMFNTPFDMYVDPNLKVYKALGMGSIAKGSKKRKKGEPAEYVKHGQMGGFMAVVMRALKVGLPLWEKGGDTSQLGGEFVFGPGNACSYAHRMQTTQDHAPILDLFKSIGVCVPPPEPYMPALDASPMSCLSSPKEVSFARASMDVRSLHSPKTKLSMPSLPKMVNRRSFGCTRSPVEPVRLGGLDSPCRDLADEEHPVIDIRAPILDIRREDSTSSSSSDSPTTSSPATSDTLSVLESLPTALEVVEKVAECATPVSTEEVTSKLEPPVLIALQDAPVTQDEVLEIQSKSLPKPPNDQAEEQVPERALDCALSASTDSPITQPPSSSENVFLRHSVDGPTLFDEHLDDGHHQDQVHCEVVVGQAL